MTRIIFSFDTEDYVNPVGADGVLRASRLVREAGFTPCHNVVAWYAKALVQWGRQDVIEELKKCELATHSLKHTYHPTILEYTDIEDFDEAMRRFRKEEDEALDILKSILGDKEIVAACPPGNSVSYVARYGYADMGIPIYDGDLVTDEVLNRPLSYCNILCLDYTHNYDYFTDGPKERILDMIEKMTDKELVIFYHHPAVNTVVDYTDTLNFNGKNIEGAWILSEKRPPEKIAMFEENLKFFLDRIKQDKRFKPTTYSELAKEFTHYRVVVPRHIPMLKKAIDEELFPVTVPDSFSLSDILLACRDFLQGKSEHICEKVYGFLDTPYAISQPVKVTREELASSADQIKDGAFLPTQIAVGDKKLGTADWLRAALAVLSGADEYVAGPDKWQIDLNQIQRLKVSDFKGTWLHSSELEDKYLSDRARLQSWTMRLPKGTNRKIYS